MNKFICIHGHFYQPPRENPWLEEVEVQESAQPYHDWNARITAECYARNGASRRPVINPRSPAARISRAQAAPIPVPPPVITTTLAIRTLL